jgi:tetratricopeptide (TPR) repeat protein
VNGTSPNTSARLLGRMAALVGAGAAWVLVAMLLSEPPAGLSPIRAFLASLAFLLGAGWTGWAFRQAWVYPAVLRRAEVLWDGEGQADRVASILDRALLARGELGYRIHLLRGRALFAQNRREEAWASFLNGELARLSFPLRWMLGPLFLRKPGRDPRRLRARVTRCFALAPRMAHLRHLAAALRLQEPDGAEDAFALLGESVRLGAEDPLLLEDAMLAAAAGGNDALAERALAALLSRHQDPRLPWNRAAGAAVLLRLDRPLEAAALLATVPEERREGPEPWEMEAAARRRLGDLDGADAALARGLEKHPGDFRLWMESHALAMADRAYDDAFSDLEEARRCLDAGEPSRQWEWDLRRAEFAWWVDGDAGTALAHLSRVPASQQDTQVPPLRLTLRAATGEHEAVLAELGPIEARHPQQAGVRILHAECLAGMKAWEALGTYLEGMDEDFPREPEVLHLRGILFANTRRLAAAREELERAAAMDPDNLRFVLDAGHACADLGEWERSEGHWKQALRLDPTCAEALLELSESRLSMHDRAGAVRLLKECLLHHPEEADAQLRLAELESQ